jgi:ATP-dependent Lhr-like helicase
MLAMATDARSEMEYLGPPPSPSTALASLAVPARDWFTRQFGTPTPAQCFAWPTISAGTSLLLSAPTGSGKSLAAFLPIVSRILMEPGESFHPVVRCLYVAPMKALGNDALRNLRAHLDGIQALAPSSTRLRTGLRTGDTSDHARRKLIDQPPDFLLTTPESLAVFLTQPFAVDLFGALRWVVVDEVHALAGNKRGADLSLSLERLDALAGTRIQRVGLSATCAPLATVARFLVGEGRACTIAQVQESTPLHLVVEPLEEGTPGFMGRLVARLEPELAGNATTLIFTNVRSLAERLVWALRRHFPEWADRIAAHHSSLSRGRRRLVERRLKQGSLQAVVTSTSLELGIDIGSVDGVVLVHPPGGVIRLLQRVGRAGHGPGRMRRGLVLTASSGELLEATVTAAASHAGQCELLQVPAHPLDVLCQQLFGMATQRRWTDDEAFAVVRQAYPYRELSREDFNDCLSYLSGRNRRGESWLPARLSWQGDSFTVVDDRATRILRRNIGTIIADEPRPVRLAPLSVVPSPTNGSQSNVENRKSKISQVGEVDEPFADRLRPGDRFLLDGRCWQFRRCEGPSLLVDEVVGRPVVPRWSGTGWPLSRELARRLYLFRARAAETLREGPLALARLLRQEYDLGTRAAAALIAHFQRQEYLSEIPDTLTCLVEAVPCDGGTDYYVHTPLSRPGNDALARIAALRLARERGWVVGSLVADLGLALFTRSLARLTAAELPNLFAAEGFAADLTEALATSETLRERFRRVALTGLMLLRNPIGRRRRVGGADWAQRRLFDKVRDTDPDFVLLRQAEREVREESCDAAVAQDFLRTLPRLTVRCRLLTQISPFVESWTQQEAGPVETIETPTEALQRLQARLMAGMRGVSG